MEEKLPGQLLLHGQIEQREGLVMRTIGRTLFSGRGPIGKEVQNGQPHGLHNAFEGAAGKTLEQDLPLLALADAQARFAIGVRRAARSPASQ